MYYNDCFFVELAHTADVGLHLRAATPAALFTRAAVAMFTLMGTAPGLDPAAEPQMIRLEAIDAESLPVDWLNELLYWHEVTGAVFSQCTIQSWQPAAGYTPQPAAQPPHLHIKAVTYHQLRLAQEAEGWVAELFFDI